MRYQNFGPWAIIGAAILWSLDGLLRRHLYDLPATVIVFWEHLFGLGILLVATLPTWKKFKELTRKQWASMVVVALLSGALGTIFYTAALAKVQYISYSVVVLLQQLQPVFAITAAVILLKEKIDRKYIGLVALAMVAAYMLSFPSLTVNFSTDQGLIAAAALAVGAAFCWGASTALSKYSLQDTSPLHVTTVRFGLTVLFALLLSAILGQSQAIGNLTVSHVGYILLITFSTGMLALALYYFGLKRVLASRSTLLELVWPLSAAVIGFAGLKEHLTLTQWIGAIVLVGVIRVLVRQKTTDQAANAVTT